MSAEPVSAPFLSAVLTLPLSSVAAPPPIPIPDRSPDAERLRAQADILRRTGIRIPLLVRRLPDPDSEGRVWSLLAGERRLTAARMAGFTTVPCVPVDPSTADPSLDPSAAAAAVAENLRAGELNLFESAAAIAALIDLAGLTQEQCADRLGVSQSYIANKLRLLRLSEEERRLMLENRLTERHGRALLRFPTPEDRAPILEAMIRREMNVSAAEEYVESLLCADARAEARRRLENGADPAPRGPASQSDPDSRLPEPVRTDLRRRMIQKDTRRFTDSIEKAVDVIRRSGIPVEARRRDTPAGTLISILVPKSS